VLKGYNFVFPLDVRFRDLDALRHVNNATYLSWLESARIAYWLRVTQREAQGLQALDMMLARTEIDYRSQLGFGDSVDIGVRTLSMKRSSFVMEFAVVHRASGRLAASAKKVLVYYDFAAGASRPLTDELRALIRVQDPEVVEAV
jgi:acyl-CoA thioester hydrolase